MQQNANEYLSAVNDVISVCKDAQEGFHGAAKAVEDPALRVLFQEYSTQRGQFAAELEAAVNRAGENANHPSGVAGKLHSGWMAIKGAATGHSSHEILEETERGEDLSVRRYQAALSHQLPDEIRSVLERQFQEVQTAHNRIRGMRDSVAH